MSTPETSMNPSTVGGQGTSDEGVLFSAFRQQRTSNRRWLLVLVVPLFGAIAAWASMHEVPGSMRIISPNGIKMVSPGMAQQDVLGMLGRPIGRETRADGSDCFQHGQFSLIEPTTTVYVLCYEGGKLKDVTTRRYSLWNADPAGNFAPAGIPFEQDAAPTASPPSPSPTP